MARTTKAPIAQTAAASRKRGSSIGKHPSAKGRFSTPEPVRRLVWIRAAGHCEQCGRDVTQDFRTGSSFRWAQVAHILPAAPQGPRAAAGHDAAAAQRETDNPDNLMLLCPSCHTLTDTDPDGYPVHDLSTHHRLHIDQIRFAARRGESQRATALIVQSQHFASQNVIRARDLLQAMVKEGLWAMDKVEVLTLPAPAAGGRDELYWKSVERAIDECLRGRLSTSTTADGDPLHLAVAGVADMPSLMRVGRQIGDRTNRHLFSRDRDGGNLLWPDPTAAPPQWNFSAPPAGNGPLALLLELSAHLRDEDILEALPGARIARFSAATPAYSLIRNRGTIDSFRTSVQPHLSRLEASTGEPIHLFPAIPAACAIEFGALLSTQHAHPYHVYDRGQGNAFVKTMTLGPRH